MEEYNGRYNGARGTIILGDNDLQFSHRDETKVTIPYANIAGVNKTSVASLVLIILLLPLWIIWMVIVSAANSSSRQSSSNKIKIRLKDGATHTFRVGWHRGKIIRFLRSKVQG
jgi:hypothetical protein